MGDAQANTPQTRHVLSGKLINVFETQALSVVFVQLVYGDCAPNLDRPQREYKLAADKTDPLVPDGCYRAPPYSRWNTLEFITVFANMLRKMAMLITTQHMWKNHVS